MAWWPDWWGRGELGHMSNGLACMYACSSTRASGGPVRMGMHKQLDYKWRWCACASLTVCWFHKLSCMCACVPVRGPVANRPWLVVGCCLEIGDPCVSRCIHLSVAIWLSVEPKSVGVELCSLKPEVKCIRVVTIHLSHFPCSAEIQQLQGGMVNQAWIVMLGEYISAFCAVFLAQS